MKKIIFCFIGGFIFSIVDNVLKNKTGELQILLGRSFFLTLFLISGFIGGQLSDGENFRQAFSNSNIFAITFFVAYFLGGIVLFNLIL